MKSTKTVEIDICDICGEEKSCYANKCSKCNKDVCDKCMESFNVTIQHVSKCDRHNSYKVATEYDKYKTMYCKECSVSIDECLVNAGFIKK